MHRRARPRRAYDAPTGARESRADLFDGVDGATCKYFNQGAVLPWQRPLGDWLDADGNAHGARPFAAATIPPGDDSHIIELDVTPLVRDWVAGTAPTSGIVLGALSPSTAVDFGSRESASEPQRPRLVVLLDDSASPVSIGPTADTWLDCSTVRSLGSRSMLRVGQSARAALQFDISPLGNRAIAKATLQLTTAGSRRAVADVGVFQLDPPKLGRGPEATADFPKRSRATGHWRGPGCLHGRGFRDGDMAVGVELCLPGKPRRARRT